MADNESEELADIDEEVDEDDVEAVETVSSKQLVLNVFDILGNDVGNRKAVWRSLKEAGVFDAGYEYFRRTYSEAIDGKHDVDSAVDDQIQSVLEIVLLHAGLLQLDTESPEQDDDRDEATRSTPSSGPNDSITTADVMAVRQNVELFRELAEYTDSTMAEFFALKTLEWLDELIESAE